ncbi:phage protein Gp27 family protein [Pseudanabaena mucicola]|uniref:DUF3486 family protein n=1 Tax=Pseudanabaena mucicola FACHB-723 TaxID=2692860 RepID=A0ABR8A179_9CYAN|nr:DUF3486 family protein [Pseudanabaena mucicola FACHB-723]
MIGAHSVPKIAKLPSPILKQLVRRLEMAHKHDQTLDDHSDWLSQKGYQISRSSVHRFCLDLRKLKSSNPDSKDLLGLYLERVKQSRMCW